jgi:sugar-specific transcriptional regulator TrmB
LGIPRRRIYDVVNILVGADVMEPPTERTIYSWKPQNDFSHDLEELKDEERRLKEEECQLDEWIKLVSNCNSVVESSKAGSTKPNASSNGSS